ncbi:camphor resistance protein CrcB [Marininema mesophilum]|uniref:Fluoride-specific ion channel FluC n=1 Tax=Marininema mesophilum TaxID=1048340 RepID=A0A1H2SDP6_9BACL|nr:CrcB family protein [Marininema mesophilum]SDW29637.1 camphor resistance protein CrcB [Marininema mesophilum]
MPYLLIGFAGACGALLRYGLSLFFSSSGGGFPWITLFINCFGSLLLAWINEGAGRFFNLSPQVKTAITSGFIGSFTTFSTFSHETITLVTTGHIYQAILYVLMSLFGGLLFAWIGVKLAFFKPHFHQGEGDR